MRGKSGGSLVYHKGSKNIHMKWYDEKGKRWVLSTRTTDEKIAHALLAEKMYQVQKAKREGIPSVSPKYQRIQVGELVAMLEDDARVRQVKSIISRPRCKCCTPPSQHFASTTRVLARFGTWKAVDVTEQVLDKWVLDLRAEKLENGSINKLTQTLGHALRLGVRRKLIPTAPHIRRLKENVRKEFFEGDEFPEVCARLQEDNRDLAEFIGYTGCRAGESKTLRWPDVDLEREEVTIAAENTKNKEPKPLPLAGPLAPVMEILRRREAKRLYIDKQGEPKVSEYVFHRNGKPIKDFRTNWRTACRKAGVSPKKTPHSLRRNAARDWRDLGLAEHEVMALMGHKTPAMTRRYAIFTGQDLRHALERVAE